MSEGHRVEGNRVFCYSCNHEWDRSRGGLQCPLCESEFVEIIDPSSPFRPDISTPMLPTPQSPPSLRTPDSFHNHYPWVQAPEENGFTTFEFNTGGGRGTFSYSSRTFTFGGGSTRSSRDAPMDDIHRNFEAMLGSILGNNMGRHSLIGSHLLRAAPNSNDRETGSAQPNQRPDLASMFLIGQGQRGPNQLPNPFELLSTMFNPMNARRGDMVASPEAFDRIMTQLMEQSGSNAPGPAPDTAIAALKKKQVDESMMSNDGKAECSICMDNVEIGDEVTVLPCNHWFHGGCVISWLREHDTCPHCRQPTAKPNERNAPTSPPSRRRTSRRPSLATSPLGPREDNGAGPEFPVQDSPIGLREARQRFYGSQRMPEMAPESRPSRSRRSSERSQPSGESASGSGGVTGWLRNRLPFSGP